MKKPIFTIKKRIQLLSIHVSSNIAFKIIQFYWSMFYKYNYNFVIFLSPMALDDFQIIFVHILIDSTKDLI